MLPKDEKEAWRHWQKQEASVDLPFNHRDPGLIQVSKPEEVATLIQSGLEGKNRPVYRQRTNGKLADPVALVVKKIKSVTQRGISSEAFLKKCHTPEDLALHRLIFGEMTDDKRAGLLLKLSKQLYEQQIAVEKANLARQVAEERQVHKTVELAQKFAKLQAFKEKNAIKGTILPPRPSEDGQ